MNLTRRERQVSVLLANGANNKEIAGELKLSELTVKIYLSRLYTKLEIGTHGNQRVRLARMMWEEEVSRCDREIAAIEALPADNPPDSCAALGWIDWHMEKRLLLEGK